MQRFETSLLSVQGFVSESEALVAFSSAQVGPQQNGASRSSISHLEPIFCSEKILVVLAGAGILFRLGCQAEDETLVVAVPSRTLLRLAVPDEETSEDMFGHRLHHY